MRTSANKSIKATGNKSTASDLFLDIEKTTPSSLDIAQKQRFRFGDWNIGRVKEWRVVLGVTLAVSAVSSFVPV